MEILPDDLSVEQNTLLAFLLLCCYCSTDSKEKLCYKHLQLDKQEKCN